MRACVARGACVFNTGCKMFALTNESSLLPLAGAHDAMTGVSVTLATGPNGQVGDGVIIRSGKSVW